MLIRTALRHCFKASVKAHVHTHIRVRERYHKVRVQNIIIFPESGLFQCFENEFKFTSTVCRGRECTHIVNIFIIWYREVAARIEKWKEKWKKRRTDELND